MVMLWGQSELRGRFWRLRIERISTYFYFIIFSAVSVGLLSLAMFVVVGLVMGKSIPEVIHNWAKMWTDLWGYIRG